MSMNFQTGSNTVTLKEAPWSVIREISIYVKQKDGQLSLYNNAECQGRALGPASLEVYKGQSTGLYFFIAKDSDKGTHFPNPNDGQLPVAWENESSCPDTVLYGKMKSDLSAFSMADSYAHPVMVLHSFDLIVASGAGGSFIHTSFFKEIDPTIVEKGEDPPSGY